MPPLLELRNVTVRRGAQFALRELTLTVQPGEHVAILGPNGCGKSTLIKTLTRECYPLVADNSAIRILGRENWNIFELRELLGIVSSDLMSLCTRDITGRELVVSGFFSSVGVWPHQQVTPDLELRAQAALDRLGVGHLADRYVTEMSSGEARRTLIARALVHEPKALLLDEPTTALDLLAQRELRETMRQLAREGLGILLVTHHLADVIPEIERVLLMREGRIVADGPKSAVLTAHALEQLFGLPLTLVEHEGTYHLW